MSGKTVAIVDYGVGNLFSIAQACSHVGLTPDITFDTDRIARADAVILPGVGAFRYAMERLQSLGMVEALQATVEKGKPLMGVCLGFQLLFDSSEEMGLSKGLGLLRGTVRSLSVVAQQHGYSGTVRLPNVAWLPIRPPSRLANQDSWHATLLENVVPDTEMYFVHSYFVDGPEPDQAIAEVEFCGMKYCCAVSSDNIFGCQFHPEKSGEAGIQVYRNLARTLEIT